MPKATQDYNIVKYDDYQYGWTYNGRTLKIWYLSAPNITYDFKPCAEGIYYSNSYGSGKIFIGELPLETINKEAALPGYSQNHHNLVSDLLLETELWEKRGFLSKARPSFFPPELVKKYRGHFSSRSFKSYKRWMYQNVYSHGMFSGWTYEKVDRLTKRGLLPEKLHSIPKWNKFGSLDALRYAIRYRTWQKKDWGLFATQYYEFFSRVFGHEEAWADFDSFMVLAKRLPKTQEVKDLFDRVYRAGLSLKPAIYFTRVEHLREYAPAVNEDPYFGMTGTVQNRLTLDDYEPPKIELQPGWKWATRTTFGGLGDKYACCVSGYMYLHYLASKVGAISYRTDTSDGGALCYYRLEANKWRIREIRSVQNRDVASNYLEQARKIQDKLQESLPAKPSKASKRLRRQGLG